MYSETRAAAASPGPRFAKALQMGPWTLHHGNQAQLAHALAHLLAWGKSLRVLAFWTDGDFLVMECDFMIKKHQYTLYVKMYGDLAGINVI